ncbi:hypothetical protein N786_17195 [Bacillus amyloliquefaciens UASWS BA1]|nr:hypothetical protein N786_17195 [Bacillus amyloliquefaciens UASWS BA1]
MDKLLIKYEQNMNWLIGLTGGLPAVLRFIWTT